jgi:hypothetical protein
MLRNSSVNARILGSPPDAHLLDARGIPVVLVDMIREPSDGLGTTSFGNVDNLSAVDIDEERHVVVAAFGRGLVDGNAPQARKVHARHGLLDVVQDHSATDAYRALPRGGLRRRRAWP